MMSIIFRCTEYILKNDVAVLKHQYIQYSGNYSLSNYIKSMKKFKCLTKNVCQGLKTENLCAKGIHSFTKSPRAGKTNKKNFEDHCWRKIQGLLWGRMAKWNSVWRVNVESRGMIWSINWDMFWSWWVGVERGEILLYLLDSNSELNWHLDEQEKSI